MFTKGDTVSVFSNHGDGFVYDYKEVLFLGKKEKELNVLYNFNFISKGKEYVMMNRMAKTYKELLSTCRRKRCVLTEKKIFVKKYYFNS